MDGLCSYSDIYKLPLIDFFYMKEILEVKAINAERAYQSSKVD